MQALPAMKSTTLTIRLQEGQRQALRRAARTLKKTESEYIRELLARDLASAPFRERVGDLAGSLDSGRLRDGDKDAFREAVRRNNRRPA